MKAKRTIERKKNDDDNDHSVENKNNKWNVKIVSANMCLCTYKYFAIESECNYF